jgi:benzaldehyde dehydrogenase (NAD)
MLTRVQLELSGNSALIVMGDADLDRTVATAACGSFFNSGQSCMVIGRHLVHELIYDEYVERQAPRCTPAARTPGGSSLFQVGY